MCDTQMPLYHASVEMSFITHADAKILKKMQDILSYCGLPQGATTL